MSIQEVDPATFTVSYFEGIKRILEVGIGQNDMASATPVLDPELYVVTDVMKSYNTPLSADLAESSFMLWDDDELDERIVRLYANGTCLPFRDNVFDAVFAANVFGDPSIPGWVKSSIISEATRVIDHRAGLVAASALWVIEYNTPTVADRFIRKWLDSSVSEGYTVEKATIEPRPYIFTGPFNAHEYPLLAGHGALCDIYKIAED